MPTALGGACRACSTPFVAPHPFGCWLLAGERALAPPLRNEAVPGCLSSVARGMIAVHFRRSAWRDERKPTTAGGRSCAQARNRCVRKTGFTKRLRCGRSPGTLAGTGCCDRFGSGVLWSMIGSCGCSPVTKPEARRVQAWPVVRPCPWFHYFCAGGVERFHRSRSSCSKHRPHIRAAVRHGPSNVRACPQRLHSGSENPAKPSLARLSEANNSHGHRTAFLPKDVLCRKNENDEYPYAPQQRQSAGLRPALRLGGDRLLRLADPLRRIRRRVRGVMVDPKVRPSTSSSVRRWQSWRHKALFRCVDRQWSICAIGVICGRALA